MIIVEPEASCPGSDFAMQDSTLVLECGDSTISVAVNTQFNCYTADADASFMELTDSTTGNPVAINDVSVNNCWQGLLSSDFEINLASPLSPGTYYLTMVDGTDGNTIQSECGYFIDPRQDTIVITVPDVPEAQIQPSIDTNTGQPLGYLAARCGEQALTITLDAPVWCSSIDPAASEWIVVDSSGPIPFVHPIQNVTYTCLHGQTAELTLHFSLPLEEGIYWLHLQDGTDNNTIVNKCNIATLPTTMLLFADNFKVALGPDIEYCKNTNFFKFLKAGPGTSYLWSTGDTTQELLIDTQGVYSVTVMNELGCSAMDTVIVTEIDCSLGIGEGTTGHFSVYPNPSQGILYLQSSENAGNLVVEIRDLNGKSVLQTTITMKVGKPTALQLQALPKGMYFVELRTSDYNEVIKVVLQ